MSKCAQTSSITQKLPRAACFGMYENKKRSYCNRWIARGNKECKSCKKQSKREKKMRFKEPILALEYQEKINKRLHGILIALSGFCWHSFRKETTITSIIRLDNPKSVHYYGRGADVRSKIFTHKEKLEICYYLNTFFSLQQRRLQDLSTRI